MLRFGLILLACLNAASAAARETIPGPVEATVEKVVDGDTLIVRASVWPGHSVRVSVRLRGIDAPENRSRCESERAAARRARDALAELVGGGTVTITDISGDKYFGRVLADVTAPDGRAVASAMLAAGHARPYRGGRRTAATC